MFFYAYLRRQVLANAGLERDNIHQRNLAGRRLVAACQGEGLTMAKETTRREVLKGGAVLAGLGMMGVPEWAFPALAQGETLVEFTDLPDEIVLERTPDRRIIDVREIDGAITPADKWFTTQH